MFRHKPELRGVAIRKITATRDGFELAREFSMLKYNRDAELTNSFV